MLLLSDWLAHNLELEPLNPGMSVLTNVSFPLPANFRMRMHIRGKIRLTRETSVRACLCIRPLLCNTRNNSNTHDHARTHEHTHSHKHTHARTYTHELTNESTHIYISTCTHEHTQGRKHTRTHSRTHALETMDFLDLTIYKGTHFHMTNILDTNHVFVYDRESVSSCVCVCMPVCLRA